LDRCIEKFPTKFARGYEEFQNKFARGFTVTAVNFAKLQMRGD